MEPSEAIAFLRRYNHWRRGYQGVEQPQPYRIGQALDTLCDHAERMDAEIEQIKATLANPQSVHINMLRGAIQWTPANLYHLLGQEPQNSKETA